MQLAGRQAAAWMRREVTPEAGALPVTQHPQNTYKVNVHWSQRTHSCSVSGGDSDNRVSDAMRFPA